MKPVVGDPEFVARVISDFASRSGLTDWDAAGVGETAFSKSPNALVEFAPVVDEYKEADREIVMNSIRFRWRDVREQLRKKIDPEAIVQDWTAEA